MSITTQGFAPKQTGTEAGVERPWLTAKKETTVKPTAVMAVAMGGFVQEVRVPKLPSDEAQRRTLEVHAEVRARNERHRQRAAAKRAKTLSL